MKKLLFILLIFLFVLTACSEPDTDGTGQNLSNITNVSHSGNILYVANTSSKTYHLPSCYLADSIKEENRLETKDESFLRTRKYTSCKICIGVD